MEVSDNSTNKNRLLESLLNRDFSAFNKYMQESLMRTQNNLVKEYSKKVKEELNV